MSIILCIETATPVCSVSLVRDGEILGIGQGNGENDHAAQLTVLISELLENNELQVNSLNAVAVSMGPGSYTGLRIGVSAAKGLCYALGIPLISVSTLHSMAYGMQREVQKFKLNLLSNPLFCPMIDARRMEVYCGFYNNKLELVSPVAAEVVSETSFEPLLKDYPVVFAGTGAQKTKEILNVHPHVHYLDGFEASAIFMAEIAEKKYHNAQFEDVVYFEPYYLKDFVAGKPKVKGLTD